MANKIICSNSITFPTVQEMFPANATCSIDFQNGNLNYGEVIVPTIAGATILYTGGSPASYDNGNTVMSTDDVSGQTLRFPYTGSTVSFLVQAGCEDIIISVYIPLESECSFRAEISDPCSCDTKIVIDGIDYFEETFLVEVKENCDASSLIGITSPNNQFPARDINTQEIKSEWDFSEFTALGNNLYELKVLTSGVANYGFSYDCILANGSNQPRRAGVVSSCNFTCECEFTALITSENPICSFNNTLDLRYNLQNLPNVSYIIEVFDTNNNLITTYLPNDLINIFTVPFINASSSTDVSLIVSVTLVDNQTGRSCEQKQVSTVNTHVISTADCTSCNQDIGCNLSCLGDSQVVCDLLLCPPNWNLPTFTGRPTCRTVNKDVNGNICSTGEDFLGDEVTIPCSSCPACERYEPTAGPNGTGGCVLDTGSNCSSTKGGCTGGCNLSTCQCNDTPNVCTDTDACNVGASGACIYCDCASCINQGPTGVCGTNAYNCPNGGTVSDCGSCIGFPELIGCTCSDSACAGFTGCDMYDDNPCIDCICVNGAVSLTENNGSSCPCGTCNNGACNGNLITDSENQTCCQSDAIMLNGAFCCSTSTCQGITVCGECPPVDSCPSDVPIEGGCLSNGDYEIVIGPVSMPADCNCDLTLSGAISETLTNYDGSIFTRIVTGQSGNSVTTTLNCN